MSEGLESIASAPETAPAVADTSEQVTEQRQEPVNLEAPVEASEEPDQQSEAPVEEFDEIEYEGERYKVPKKLKNGFLMQSDYTRKTQEVAEQRKTLEAQQKAFEESAEAARVHHRNIGKVINLDEQISELDKTDWDKLHQEDFVEAQRLLIKRQTLQNQRDGLIAQIQTTEHQRSQEAQQSFAKRYADTNETLARDIKGWNQDVANKLVEFAKTNGATDDDIRAFAVNAPLVKLLHKAWLGEQVVTAKQNLAKTEEPRVIPKPLPKVTGSGARPAVNLFDADMESYVEQRRKQGFGKR